MSGCRALFPLIAAALALTGCRDLNYPEPTRSPGDATAAKSGIPDTLPLRIEQNFHADPGAPRLICSVGTSLPSRLLGEGVVAPHMGRTTSIAEMDFCLVIDDTLYFSAHVTYRGATGDSLSGVWDGRIANFHNTTSELRLVVLLLDGADWFRKSFGSASAAGTIELESGSGVYLAQGNVGPRPTPTATAVRMKPQTISAGSGMSCGLAVSGAAFCWGSNVVGQLGDGTIVGRYDPRPVAGGLTFREISTGFSHACGLTTAGQAYCWGLNTDGQLGDGTTTPRPSPVRVAGGLTFIEISAGRLHTCGLTASGVAYCWGDNYWSALGDGTSTDRSTPTKVSGRIFSQISAGGYHTCGLVSSGLAYCWGYNLEGQLGTGTTTSYKAPVTAVLGSAGLGFAQISAGDRHTCALTSAGAAYCWGHDNVFQLGDGVPHGFLTSPVAVGGGHVYAQIRAGDMHTCAVTVSGAGHCWGNNQYGQLGNGTADNIGHIPYAVVGGLVFAQISAGDGAHSCAVSTEGIGYCWGLNDNGQLGVPVDWIHDQPIEVSQPVGGLAITQLDGGAAHTCAVTAFGTAYCWGLNAWGQLGDGTTSSGSTPVVVPGSLTFQGISAGGHHTCGLTTAGEAYCWGYNDSGQLGDGSTNGHLDPTPVGAGHTFVHISAGIEHTCGLTSPGDVYCWGSNAYGQLGDGTTTSRLLPTLALTGGQAFTSITTGSEHTCALTSSGAAYCWGNDALVGHRTPTLVPNGVVFKQLTAGVGFTCGLDLAGSGYCWGSNVNGQLGDGTTDAHDTPKPVSGGRAFAEIAAGERHVCAIGVTSGTYCWGSNDYGQLGNNTLTQRLIPTAVYWNPKFDHIAVGLYHSCGIIGGTAYCWGRNDFGQLGDNSKTNSLTPRRVKQLFFKW